MHRLRRSPDYLIVPRRSRCEALERACAHPRADQAARVVVTIDTRPRSDLGCLSRSPSRQPPRFIYGGITDYRRTLLVHGATRACSVFSAIVGGTCGHLDCGVCLIGVKSKLIYNARWWARSRSVTPCRLEAAETSSPCTQACSTDRSCPFIQSAWPAVNSEPSEANTRICPGLSGRSESTIRSAPANLSVNVVLQLA